MLNTKEEIQDYLNKYGGLFIGITIDRGCGAEYFTIVDTGVSDEGNTYLILENTEDEEVNADFLDSCDFVRFHLTDAIVVKEEPLYNITFKASEIREFTDTLNTVAKILGYINRSDVEYLQDNIQNLINKLNIK